MVSKINIKTLSINQAFKSRNIIKQINAIFIEVLYLLYKIIDFLDSVKLAIEFGFSSNL
jgi:hypothetical protein